MSMHKCGLFYTTYAAEDGLFRSRFQKLCLASSSRPC